MSDAAHSRRWPLVATAAALVLAAFFAIRILSPIPPGGASDPLAQEILDSHLRSLFPGHLTDIASPDPDAIRSWFGGKLDYSLPVTDFSSRGYPLAGARLDVLAGRTVAALVYRRNQHIVTLYAWPSPGAQETGSAATSRRGYNLLRWDHAGMNCWMVSDLNSSELETLAGLLRSQVP